MSTKQALKTAAKKATPKKAVAKKAVAKKATPTKAVSKRAKDEPRARLNDDEVRAAIRGAVKADPTMSSSWTRTLRHLRAEGLGGSGYVRFRELFEEVTGGKAAKKATPPAKKAPAKKAAKATSAARASRRTAKKR